MGDHQRKRSADCRTSSLRSSLSSALKDVPDMSSSHKQGTVKKSSQGNKRRRTGVANPSSDDKSTCEEKNQSSSTSSQSSDKQHSPCSFTYPNNHNLSKHYCSNGQTGYSLQSSHCESSFTLNSYTKPQQLLSTNYPDNLISTKTSLVHTSDEKNKASFSADSLDLVDTVPKNNTQCNDTNVQSTTQPIVSENSEIQASILALESLLQVKSSLKNKDIATKSCSKPQLSERIASKNSKWEDDEKLGARATLGPVLYSNICLNLKESHPEWTSRAAAITYIWQRQLSEETRKIYSEMAKRNKQLLNDQPKRSDSKQVDKSLTGSQVTDKLAYSTRADKNLRTQKSLSTSNMMRQPVQPSKTSTSQSKSLSSTAEISLEGNSIKIKSSGQQLAIKRPIKSDSSLITKKSILASPTAKDAHSMDPKKFMEQPTDKQIEFFRIRARYLRYRRSAASLILNDDLYNDMPLSKDCVLTGEYGNAKLKGNWDTYANYPLHNDKK